MSKKIPPPPPKPRTQRASTKVNYLTPKVQRQVLRTKGRRTPDTFDQAAKDYKVLVDAAPLLPGSPRIIESNMPAVSSAIGATDERGAQRKREREYRVGWDGRTSNLPELGATPRMSDNERAGHDGK